MLSIRFLGALTQGDIDLLFPEGRFISMETKRKKLCSGIKIFDIFSIYLYYEYLIFFIHSSHINLLPNYIPQYHNVGEINPF